MVAAAADRSVEKAAVGRDSHGSATFVGFVWRGGIGGGEGLPVHEGMVFKTVNGDVGGPFVNQVNGLAVAAENQMARAVAFGQAVFDGWGGHRRQRTGIKRVLVDAVVAQVGDEQKMVVR